MARGRPPRTEVAARLDVQVHELWDRMGGLPTPTSAAAVWRGIWYEEAHHSTAIEGNTLVLKQVAALLESGKAVGAKELTEYLEVRGYADAADWVYAQASDGRGDLITMTELRQVHRLALGPVWEVAPHPDATDQETPGNLRQHHIEAFPDGMRPPTWPLVPAEIQGWLDEARSLEGGGPGFPVRLARLHCRFEQIHPFIDGNGRAGRLAMNLLLVRLRYPPVIIFKKQRATYLRALRRADAGNPEPLGEVLARAILTNLHRFVIPAVAGPHRLVPVAALASRKITAGALRAAAIRGALEAEQGPDGQWRSTRSAVDRYLRSRYKRR